MDNSLQIYINGQLADYTNSDSFPLVFSERGVNVSNISERSGTGSFTVQFPFTEANHRIFKSKHVPAITNKYTQTKYDRAEVYANGQLIFQGQFKVMGVTGSYEGFFISADAAWISDIQGNMRDLKILEIDFTAHFNNGDNLPNLMDKTRSEYPAVHPAVCYGGFFNSSIPGVNNNAIYLPDLEGTFTMFPPHLYIKELINFIFYRAGWKAKGDIFDPIRDNWILSKEGKDESFWNWKKVGYVNYYLTTDADISFNIINKTFVGDFYKTFESGTVNCGGIKPYVKGGVMKKLNSLIWSDVDLGHLIIENTYTCPIDGSYYFASNIDFSSLRNDLRLTNCDSGMGNSIKDTAIYIAVLNWAGTDEDLIDSVYNSLLTNTGFDSSIIDWNFRTPPTSSFFRQVDGEFDIDLAKGDEVKFYVMYFHSEVIQSGTAYDFGARFSMGNITNAIGTIGGLVYSGINIFPFNSQSNNCIKNYDTDELVPAYDTLQLGRCLPNIKCEDFIAGIMKQFNLFTDVDIANRVVTFKYGNKYYKSSNDATDITKYIDYSSYKNEPLGMPKRFELLYINDENDSNDDTLDIKTIKIDSSIYSGSDVSYQLPFSNTLNWRFLDWQDREFTAPYIKSPNFNSQEDWLVKYGYNARFFEYLGRSLHVQGQNNATIRFYGGLEIYLPICKVPDNIGTSNLYSNYYKPLFGDYKTKEKAVYKMLCNSKIWQSLQISKPVIIDSVAYKIIGKNNYAPARGTSFITLELERIE